LIDIKPVFQWIHDNGEAKATQRVLMKSILSLKKFNIQFTNQAIENSEIIKIPKELYTILVSEAEKVVGQKYERNQI
jgi:hypothetical protein